MHNIIPVEKLTIADINALAQAAVERGETLEQSNHYPGHIGVAFAAAYMVHAQEVTV